MPDLPASEAEAREFDGEAMLLAVYRAAERVTAELDLARALETIIACVRNPLGLDRAGVFIYRPRQKDLIRLIGVGLNGAVEHGPEDSIPIDDGRGPMQQVALGRIPFFHSHDVRRDVLPELKMPADLGAHAIVPLINRGEIIGVMAVDNQITGRDIAAAMIRPLCLFGHFAALALGNAMRAQDLAELNVKLRQEERMRKQFYRDVLFCMTNGKLLLCDREDIDRDWSGEMMSIAISATKDIKRCRDLALAYALAAGISEERAGDLCLCTSEAATNALKHAGAGRLSLSQQEGVFRVRVTDHGAGIDAIQLPHATLMRGFSTRASMGLGFTLMHEMSDRLCLATDRNGTTLILEMAVNPKSDLDRALASMAAEES